MNVPTTLGAFALGMIALFGGATALGSAVGPVGPSASHGTTHGTQGGTAHGMRHGTSSKQAVPAGLSVSEEGYTLALDTSTLVVGKPSTLSFTVTGPDGGTLTSYTRTHDKDLHLIVVRRDLSSFQHVHPSRDAAGRWSVPLTLSEPGAYKVFADFAPKGRTTALVLGTDLTVAGSYAPRPLPETSRTTTVDGYTVTLEGDLAAGEDSQVVLTVSRDGRAVTDLQPYLAAFGHLVAVRPGDLAYLHVHPEDGKPAPGITFTVDVPTPGAYRLFLDFKRGDQVHTAAFTVNAQGS